MKRVVLATSNPGKVRELQALLEGAGWNVIPQSFFGVPDADETGLSFAENALLKARHAARHTGLPAIADDSGIAVDALNGAPGIYSARYAGGAGDAANNAKLLDAMRDVPDAGRGARFVCLMVYLRHAEDPLPVICQGVWEGRLLLEPRGTNGFGYDPLFFVPTHGCSSAELPPGVKNQISHRSQALRALVAQLPAQQPAGLG
jgi:XTP/dITP diphosphohydrolase